MVAFEKLAFCKEKLGECVWLRLRKCVLRACTRADARALRAVCLRPWMAGKHLETAGYAAKDSGTASAEEARAHTRSAHMHTLALTHTQAHK